MTFSIEEVLKATGGKLLQGKKNASFRGVSTDSRTVREGDLFVALKGARFDGHQYAVEALKKNAGGILIEEDKAKTIHWNGFRSKAIIAVKDTLRSLGDLAGDRRERNKVPVVALTGSNGKTTTKEMISACLETTGAVLKTRGNYNNLIGLPLTLLSYTGKEKVAVVEMGMNVPGEIGRLTEIANPDVGLITNIHKVHLEGLGSLERVKEEKGELFRKMKRDGTIVVNQNDPRVIDLAQDFPGRKVTFGVETAADVVAKKTQLLGAKGVSFLLSAGGQESEVILPVLGRHFVPAALAAVAVSMLFGVEFKRAKEALEQFKPFPMRMEVCPLRGGRTLINDAYNANPKSMELSLETLVEVKGAGRAVAVFGDMLELGDFAKEAHRQLGQRIKALSIDFLLVMGKWAPVVVESAVRHGFDAEKTKIVQTHEEAIATLEQVTQEGDWILIKGSRGMAMEKVVEGLQEGRA